MDNDQKGASATDERVAEEARRADVTESIAPGQRRSEYLAERLQVAKERNLFNHVKFHLVKQEIDKLQLDRPAILDVGCGLQVSRKYLESLELDFDYFGIDYEPEFEPDAVVDLLNPSPPGDRMPTKPDVVLILDVLEHLTPDRDHLKRLLSLLRAWIPDDATVIVTLPQMYRLDRFKLPHLHYPEHKIRLRQEEWRDILTSTFDIQSTQGLGYLSVIPYLPMASKRYRNDNALGSLFKTLREKVFEWEPLKPADLWLSNSLGQRESMKTIANDVLFVCTPKAR